MFDKVKFRNLLIKARGDRNNLEYAEDTGLSRTYISKYMNLKLDNPPSPEAIQKLVNKTQNNVTYKDMMIAAGHIEPEQHSFAAEAPATYEAKPKKTLEMIKKSFEEILDISYLPVVGTIAAGMPILAEEHIESYLPYPKEYDQDTHFVFRVQGDSMKGAGINDGDLVVIRMQPTAENGQIAAVRLPDNGITLKKYYANKNVVDLKPCNGDYKPISIREDVDIIGIAVLITKNLLKKKSR
jgi:repressor LexA